MHPPFLHGSLSDISFPPLFDKTTVPVEVTCFKDAARVAIIKDNGVFTGQDVLSLEEATFTIGGRYGDSPQSLKGAISSIDFYTGKETRKDDDGVPDALKQLIIQNQMVVPQDDYEPPVKKSKKNQ